MPDISIIILTFNSARFIGFCLDSLFSQEYQDFEVIVVDNGSTDSTAGFIKENYPRIRLIENKKNLGTSKARNHGIEVSQGRWILALDCDVILEKDFLKKIMNFVEESQKPVGMFQPKILKNDKKTIQSCGIHLSNLRRFYDIGKGKSDNGRFNKTMYVFGACSAAALYRREMLEALKEDTGYFDERFFFLVEDVDLSWRAQRKNWKALYCPEAVCYHFGNSSNYDKDFRQYLCFRNRYFMLLKNQGFPLLMVRLFLSLPYELSRFLYFLSQNKYALRAVREIARFL